MSALRTTDVQYVSCGEPVRATSAEQRVSLSAESLDVSFLMTYILVRMLFSPGNFPKFLVVLVAWWCFPA